MDNIFSTPLHADRIVARPARRIEVGRKSDRTPAYEDHVPEKLLNLRSVKTDNTNTLIEENQHLYLVTHLSNVVSDLNQEIRNKRKELNLLNEEISEAKKEYEEAVIGSVSQLAECTKRIKKTNEIVRKGQAEMLNEIKSQVNGTLDSLVKECKKKLFSAEELKMTTDPMSKLITAEKAIVAKTVDAKNRMIDEIVLPIRKVLELLIAEYQAKF